jgi:hypothetical protein
MSSTSDVDFRSSSFCGADSCVQVGFLADSRVAIRDGKDLSAGQQMFTRNAWAAFLHAVRAGEFDR